MVIENNKQPFDQLFFVCKKQNENDKIYDEKQTRRFIEERETERINGFNIFAMVQTKVNISIFNKTIKISMLNKDKVDQNILKLAKKIVKNFANKVPKVSCNYLSIDQEREQIKVFFLANYIYF